MAESILPSCGLYVHESLYYTFHGAMFRPSHIQDYIVHSDYVIKYNNKCKTNNNTGYVCQNRYSV